MKKILSIAPYTILPYKSGGQRLIAQFNEYLGAMCNLTVIGTKANQKKLVSNYELLSWMPNQFYRYLDISLVMKSIRLVKKNNIGFLIIEHPYMAWLAFVIRKACTVKWVIHTHNVEYQRFRSIGKKWWPLLRIYENWALKSADIVFCISSEDKDYMVNKIGLSPQKCTIIPYGITTQGIPNNKIAFKKTIAQKHQIPNGTKILLFNGFLNYLPNEEALMAILNEINPILLNQASFNYKIIVCGKNLPEKYNNLSGYKDKNILYAGFVEDIDTYLQAADIFINPVNKGGGVKTKIVEALSQNLTVISTPNGATGCDKSVCGDKLVIVPDEVGWEGFANTIIQEMGIEKDTPPTFYEKYYWGNIAQDALNALNG